MNYDPRRYWGDLHREDTLRSVAHPGLPEEFNAWLYRIGDRNLDAFLRRHGVGTPATVFDAGAGNGYWVAYWTRRGARVVDGCDLVPDAVGRLNQRFDGAFHVADLSDSGAITRRYDLVSAMNVLLHITDDAAFGLAAQNIARAVAPGGHLLVADAALRHRRLHPIAPGASSVARPVAEFRSAIEPAGLEFVAEGATTVVGANPIDARSGIELALWHRVWDLASRVAGRGRGGAAGRVLAAIDRPLMLTGLAPSGKFLLWRRAAA